ncbi:MAG: hypothetical protein E7C23_12455, partial [Klebsiella grimontii]|nr:hypothetical protein [Klebsiella grimontii]
IPVLFCVYHAPTNRPSAAKKKKFLSITKKNLTNLWILFTRMGLPDWRKVARTGAQHRLREDPLPLNMHPTELQIRN